MLTSSSRCHHGGSVDVGGDSLRCRQEKINRSISGTHDGVPLNPTLITAYVSKKAAEIIWSSSCYALSAVVQSAAQLGHGSRSRSVTWLDMRQDMIPAASDSKHEKEMIKTWSC